MIKKLDSTMDYWNIKLTPYLEPLLIGIEHKGDEVHGVLLRNPAKNTSVSISGAELKAIMMAINHGHLSLPSIELESSNSVV